MAWLGYTVFLLFALALAYPLGLYLACVFSGTPTWLDPILRPIEHLLHRAIGREALQEMSARAYFGAFALFGLLGAAFLFALQMAQTALPGGPADAVLTTSMSPDLAANTAISFATTTTWQAYGGETTLRYATQMLGLVSQNFLAGGAGLAIGIAFIRGLARERAGTLVNSWSDLIRALLWVLLPASFAVALALVWQGVPANFSPYTNVATLEGGQQLIAQGPVAALESIKNLGTNGGGFFNANGAHPYENPTALTNVIAMLSIMALPAALTTTFGKMTGRPRAGLVLLGVMMVLFVGALAICDQAERTTPAPLAALHLAGGGLEGKETRFGVAGSVLAAVVTSNGATGSYNAMHDSFSAIGVGVPFVNMLLGEVVFGGLGTGLIGMVLTTLVAAFLGGLMIGRTPSYLGKRITAPEARLTIVYALLSPLAILPLTAYAVSVTDGLAGLTTNQGPRGFTEFSSPTPRPSPTTDRQWQASAPTRLSTTRRPRLRC